MAFTRTRFDTIDCTCANMRPHGTVHCYDVHSCGCEPCREAHRIEQSVRRARKHSTVPAGPILDHLDALNAAGLSDYRISVMTGYTRSAIYYIRHHGKRVHVYTAEDILSVPVPKEEAA